MDDQSDQSPLRRRNTLSDRQEVIIALIACGFGLTSGIMMECGGPRDLSLIVLLIGIVVYILMHQILKRKAVK